MSRDNIRVPYGYEPAVDSRKGTLVYYDTFDGVGDEELDLAVKAATSMAFRKLVLYPLHESTAKRMTPDPIRPYYRRMDALHDWRKSRGLPDNLELFIDGMEGKRKKYTPIDSALRHLAETYGMPIFLFVTPEKANLFASYDSFEPWIVKIRLLLTEGPSEHQLHPKLAKYAHRWNVVSEEISDVDRLF